MTVIPEPTEEDFEFARDMLNSLEERPEIALMEDFCSMWLVLAHYQRENERLKDALKSALADTERIDWLEKGVILMGKRYLYSSLFYNKGQTLREAIDERRKA